MSKQRLCSEGKQYSTDSKKIKKTDFSELRELSKAIFIDVTILESRIAIWHSDCQGSQIAKPLL